MKTLALKQRILFLLIFIASVTFGEDPGSIKGKVTDNSNGEPVPFANVFARQGDQIIAGAQTDLDGNYFIKPLNPGKYTIETSSVGFSSRKIEGVIIKTKQITFLDIKLSFVVELKSVEIITYQKPRIAASGSTTTRSDIQKMPGQCTESLVQTMGGVSTANPAIRGARSGKTYTYIDGIKVRGSKNLPTGNCSSEILIVTGGVPANFENESTVVDDKLETPYTPTPQPSGSEEYPALVESPFALVKKEPLSTFSIDVDVASYANVRRMLNYGNLPTSDAIRTEEMINYFAYNLPEPKENEAFSISSEVADCPWNKKSQLLHVAIKGKTIPLDHLPASSLTFLVDVSGSMTDENKLPLAKQALKALVNNLKNSDRVAIVTYAGSSGLALPSTSCSERSVILSAIDRMTPGGSTAGSEGIKLAYEVAKENFLKSGNNRVILITDGDFNVGITSPAQLENLISEKRKDGIFLSVLGFGMGNYKDNRMEILADKGNGNYAYIDSYQEAQRVLIKEMGGTLHTIAKDVKIQIEFNPAVVKAYRLIGYDDRLLAAEDFNNDKKDAGEVGSGQSVTAIYEIQTGAVDLNNDNRPDIDPLKYQQKAESVSEQFTDEILTIKIRHKKPASNVSNLISKAVKNQHKPLDQASENMRFSVAVAGFAQILRGSSFIKNYSLQQVEKLASSAIGKDTDGYRSEFIRLIKIAEQISQTAKQ